MKTDGLLRCGKVHKVDNRGMDRSICALCLLVLLHVLAFGDQSAIAIRGILLLRGIIVAATLILVEGLSVVTSLSSAVPE